MVRLNRTYYSLLKFTSKIFKNCLPQSNSSELRKFRAICPHSRRITRNWHILLTYSTLCFRHLPRQRTLRNSSELRKFRAIRPHSPRITQNSHILLTYSTLCYRHLPQQRMLRNSSELRKFRAIRPHSPPITQNLHHLLTLHHTFQMPDQWQRTP